MLTQGEQLILLALNARQGVIRSSRILPYGLKAAVLSELLERGLITLRQPDGSWGVTPVAGAEPASGHPALETFWADLEQKTTRPHPDTCVAESHEGELHVHLEALRKRGVIEWDAPKRREDRYGRFRLVDTGAAAEARARMDRVRRAAGPDRRDHDLAAIAACIGLAGAVYPGISGRKKRAALASAVQKQRFTAILTRTLPKTREFKITINSSNDLAMARDLIRAVNIDAHHSGYGYDGGSSAGYGYDGGSGGGHHHH